VEKYRYLIRSQIQILMRERRVPGYNYDDLMNEGLLVLHYCAFNYNSSSSNKFSTFFVTCFKHRIYNLFKNSNNNKAKTLNLSHSLDNHCRYVGENTFHTLISETSENLSLHVHTKIEIEQILRELVDYLKPEEKTILALHLEGYSYYDISVLLDTSYRKVAYIIKKIREKATEITS